MWKKAASKAALALLAGLLVGVALVFVAWSTALSRLEQAGVEIGHSARGWPVHRVMELRRGPVFVEELAWNVLAPTRVHLWGVEVQLEGAGEGLSTEGEAAQLGTGTVQLPELPAWLRVQVHDLAVLQGERVWAEGLEGKLSAAGGLLEGDGVRIAAPGPDDALVDVQATRPSPVEAIRGSVDLHLQLFEDGAWAELRAERLVLKHSLLSQRKLPIEELVLTLEGDPRQAPATGELWLGELSASLSLDCTQECLLGLSLPDTDAARVLAVAAPILPELRGATVGGSIGADATLRWPSGEWTLEPRLRDLRVEGAVQGLDALRYGRFDYMVFDAEGERRVRSSGEGTRDWTPLALVSPHLVQAVIAAEDSAFPHHAGYSEEAIVEALLANREEGRVVRGGSTLTQQLAKNLFLDGERTIERKLRELLLAVELDRALGKDRVMELYVNVVEWGPDLWGISAASDRYFLRKPAALPPNEAAFLAAILPDPKGYYTRWYLRDRAGSVRIDWILSNMADGGALSRAEARRQARLPLRFVPPPRDAP